MLNTKFDHVFGVPIREGKRIYYMCKCVFCGDVRKVRKDNVKKIKSCHSCHHKQNRPKKPDGNFEWCSKCVCWKPFDDFCFRSDGTIRACKVCENDYRLKNLVKINEYAKQYRKNNIEKSLFYAAKHRAKKNNLDFNIEISDVVVPDKCPILGIQMLLPGNKNHSPSLDKTIPSLGYVKGNVRVISWRANWIKNNMTAEEVEKLYEDSRKWKCQISKSVP